MKISILLFLFLPLGISARQIATSEMRKTSMLFLENKGQIRDQYCQPRKDIDFKLNAPGINIFIANGQIHYQWTKQLVNPELIGTRSAMQSGVLDMELNNAKIESYRLDVILLGVNKNAELVTGDVQNYYENYYLPPCPTGAKAHSYKKITYKNIYPNIDWVIYIQEQNAEISDQGRDEQFLKYDFVVHEGGDSKDIRIQYKGATSLLLKGGVLTAVTPFGSVMENAPYSYATKNKKENRNKKNEVVASKFVLEDGVLSFEVAPYTGSLVIDPQLEWATYYGGTNEDNLHFLQLNITRAGGGIAIGDYGHIYLAGGTRSTGNIATTGAYRDTIAGNTDGFISCFSALGVLQWATYFGGVNHDAFSSISISGSSIYTAGWSFSMGLGTAGTYQPLLDTTKWNTNDTFPDALIVNFKTDGSLAWCTYFGGEHEDFVEDMIANDGSIYIAGTTASDSGIATSNAYQATHGSHGDNFLARFDSSGKRSWATYYGGDIQEFEGSLVLDALGHIYLCGTTNSKDNIATPGSYQSSIGDMDLSAYLVQFDTNGVRQWATYYGRRLTNGFGLTIDRENNVYLFGWTSSMTDIATPGAYKDTLSLAGNRDDAFLAKFNTAGVRQWGTYFGSEGHDEFWDAVVDKNNDICLVGTTTSIDNIATTGAWRTTPPIDTGTQIRSGDGMFVKFDKNGNRLWATYYGSSGFDGFHGIAADASNNSYMMGWTRSDTSIATPGSHQEAYGGNTDIFLVKAAPDSIVYFEKPFNDTIICLGVDGRHTRVGYIVSRSFRAGNVFTVELSDVNGSFTTPTIIGTKTSSASGYIDCNIPATMQRGKGYRIRVVASAPFYISNDNGIDILLKDGPEKPVATGDTVLCMGSTLQLSATCPTPGVSFSWAGPNNFSDTKATTTRPNAALADSGNYIVTVSPPECKRSDTVHLRVKIVPLKPDIIHNAPLCEGDTLSFYHRPDTSTATTYALSAPPGISLAQTKVVATTTMTGQYIVTSTYYGCTNADTAFIEVKHKPDVQAANNGPLTEGSELKLSAISDSANIFSWHGPDGFTDTGRSLVISYATVLYTGIYTVIATHRGCSDSANTVVQVNNIDEDIIVLFPNPNNGRFTIKGVLKLDQQMPIVIFNSLGQEVYRDKIITSGKTFDHAVTMPAIANGVYRLQLQVNGRNQVYPFTVAK